MTDKPTPVQHGSQPEGNPPVQHGDQPAAQETVQVQPNGGIVADFQGGDPVPAPQPDDDSADDDSAADTGTDPHTD